jgi:hypothetical protein
MIDIRWWVGGLFLLGGMLATFGLGLAIGREWPSRRAVAERYGLEVSDLEGYDDAQVAERDDRLYDGSSVLDHHPCVDGSVLAGRDWRPDRAVTTVMARGDWREQTAAELAPAHLDELAERIDLPGPDASTLVAARASHSRAGELDWPTDTRLPAILTLGQAGDGTDKTFARASLAQWDFMVRFRDERDELDRMLAAGRTA